VRKIREESAEKQKSQKEYYEIRMADMKKAKQAALEAKDQAAVKKYQELEDKYKKRMLEKNAAYNERINQMLAKNRVTVKTVRENQKRAGTKEQIKKNANAIVSYFNTNTDKKHIVEALKEPVARFVTAIDFTGADDSKAALEWNESLNRMRRLLDSQKDAGENGYQDIYDALHNYDNSKSDILSDMDSFLESYNGLKLSEMSTASLEQLNKLLRALRTTITNANKLVVNQRTQSVAKLGRETIQELEQKKDRMSHSKVGEAVLSVTDAGMLDARSFFYRLGDAGMSIYDGLREGFNDRVWKLKDAETYMKDTLEGLDVKEWTGDKAKVHTFVINGKELKMTTGQIMGLYELQRRDQALMHILYGGIKPTKIGKGVRAIERVKAMQNITEFDLDNITSVLTADQKRVADAMQQFMAKQCSEWGNETTMKLYGYERFNAGNYYPITVDKASVDTKEDSAFFGLKNKGFTKSTVKNAVNALVVDDIFDVFTKHVTDMASYASYTGPLLDAMKWYNFRDIDYSGEYAVNNGNVKTEIERAYGKNYLKFFEKLIKDINAESNYDFTDSMSKMLVSNMKAASVGANLRVAIQQPTAIMRAMAVMDPKYFAKAVIGKSYIQKSKEHSAITQWKSWGYFETSIGQSMKSVITGQQSLKENITEKTMILAQWGDDVTWGYIWKACENEIQDKHPELEYDSEEFLEAVSKRFDDVVDQTQVVDSVLHRSHIMRNQNGTVQMATAFMAESTKSYNLLMNRARDVYEGKRGAKKAFVRAAVAFTVTSFVNAIAQSIMDAVRDDDDEKSYLEKLYANIWPNFKDNMNLFSMIPYAKDIISMIQGYNVERMDMQALSNFISGVPKIYKWLTNETDSSGVTYREKYTLYQSMKSLIQGVSQLSGEPVYNLLRDIGGFYFTITGNVLGGTAPTRTDRYGQMVDEFLAGDEEELEELKQLMEGYGVGNDKISDGMKTQAKNKYVSGEITDEDYKRILTDYFDMSDSEAEDLLSTAEVKQAESSLEDDYDLDDYIAAVNASKADESTKDSNIKSKVKENWKDGNLSDTDAIKYLKKELDLSDGEAYFTVQDWQYGSKYGQLYTELDSLMESGDSDRTKVISIIENYQEKGVEDKNIASAITSRYKSDYLESPTANKKSALISAYRCLGYTYDEAKEKIEKWEK
jgi:hypothetical protein